MYVSIVYEESDAFGFCIERDLQIKSSIHSAKSQEQTIQKSLPKQFGFAIDYCQ